LDAMKKNVASIKSEIENHNHRLADAIRPRLELRKAKLLRDKGMVEALGFPIRPKAGAQATYAAPIQRKRLVFQAPKVSAESFVPEPRLELAEYDHILNTVANMALVFERSPIEFVKMREETLRTHILVQLNAQYEGRATGETFNGEGKTDILIRENGKNIFIAECKFWKGGESFTATIDQLLNYTTWRDAKTAIVIFNRNKNTSAVNQQIPDLAKVHPQFKSADTKPQPEGRFRFTFRQKNDGNRQFLLTVMVFDVPV
jgi:hypothetical protein